MVRHACMTCEILATTFDVMFSVDGNSLVAKYGARKVLSLKVFFVHGSLPNKPRNWAELKHICKEWYSSYRRGLIERISAKRTTCY